MAVAVLSRPASMTVEQYDRVVEQLAAIGAGEPPGRRFHACVGDRDRLMVFEVWDSADDFEAFRVRLSPILLGEQVAPPPVDRLEVHRLVEGGDAGALRRTIAELREKAFFIRPVEKLRAKLHGGRATSSGDESGGPATT